MSRQVTASDLLVDLSTTEQQIIAGGQDRGGDQEEFRGEERGRRRRYECRYCYDCRPYRD